MKYKIFITLLLQFVIGMLCAQQVLKGVVTFENEEGQLESIPFANVYWEGTNYGTSTDSSGAFQLAVPKEGATTLITSFIGFKVDTSIVENFKRSIAIRLVRSNELDAVDVNYRRKSSEMSFINPIQTINMNEKELFKAACCNLSESFETNPSVDVNFTDAVTGAKQIRMLGLNGPYTMISRENMPGIRGLANAYGLGSIPGTWINSIQVTKGVGSVVNGYESIAGQINVELQKPDIGEQTFFNLFANEAGRTEANLVHTEKFSEHLGTTFLLHGNIRPIERDRNNKDGFRDFPLQQQVNFMNRWKFNTNRGWMGQIGIQYFLDDKEGGQTDELKKEELASANNGNKYRVNIKMEKVEVFGKLGYVFSNSEYKSMGFQWQLTQHDLNTNFGIRDYNSLQQSFYGNWIYQSIIGSTTHQFKTGLSFVYDNYDEQFEANDYDRIERVPGAFFEYTFKPTGNFTLVAGIRGDHHNLYDAFVTPRLHLRYALNETTVLRGVGGSGQRSPTTLVDRQSLMASSRRFIFPTNNSDLPYGLEMEKAWNVGVNLTKNFSLDYREGTVQVDFYHTNFENQVVVDLEESAREVLFYNLQGQSYSNTAQFQLDYELIKFLDLRLAYRWVQVKTEFISGVKQQPLTPEHRFFVNLGYETTESANESNWTFDLTMQWVGEQRIPTTVENSAPNQRATSSEAFAMVSSQVTRNFSKRLAVYVGIENAFNFQQKNPIIGADNPFGNEFDASLVWGPIFGRNLYGGLRWRIQKEE